MPGTDALDDASADHEQFEAELVAQDQDAARVTVADIDERRAHSLVNDLVDDVVIPIPDERVLVHEPSDEAFDSILQLAVFHRGWTAARDAGEGGQ
jgi:hypothetical protein